MIAFNKSYGKKGRSHGKLDFSSIIRKDREERKVKYFEGTFLDYLEIVKENPDIPMLAHQRMYKMIVEPGVKVIKTDENPRSVEYMAMIP